MQPRETTTQQTLKKILAIIITIMAIIYIIHITNETAYITALSSQQQTGQEQQHNAQQHNSRQLYQIFTGPYIAKPTPANAKPPEAPFTKPIPNFGKLITINAQPYKIESGWAAQSTLDTLQAAHKAAETHLGHTIPAVAIRMPWFSKGYSAGLAIALYYIELNTGELATGDAKIAITGAITSQGITRPVEYLDYKTAVVNNTHMDLYIIPQENLKQAQTIQQTISQTILQTTQQTISQTILQTTQQTRSQTISQTIQQPEIIGITTLSEAVAILCQHYPTSQGCQHNDNQQAIIQWNQQQTNQENQNNKPAMTNTKTLTATGFLTGYATKTQSTFHN